jgi:CDP-diacylglycerol--inositol 3-phosphatidyltransferase
MIIDNNNNDIGYLRIITALIAYWYFFSWPMMTVISYSISLNLDNVDGPCARYFKQCTKFGAVFDMIIDRMSTIIFMMHISVLIPSITHWMALLSIIDFSSHWL